jgi:hypothetical protein
LIRAALALAVAVLLVSASEAAAQSAGSAPTETQTTLTIVPLTGGPPTDRVRAPQEVVGIALRVPKVRRARAQQRDTIVRAYLKGRDQWQVSVFARPGNREIAQVLVDDRTGRVAEAWTGVQVAWTMARGYKGAFGRRANALYLWLPLLALFLAPFLRPPYRWVHLDLLAVASFSVSFAFFNHAEIGASVPLSYPPLVYLLVRMLAIARSRSAPAVRLLGSADTWLMGIVFLFGLRLGLNLTSSNIIDVGYAGVIGADHITHGAQLYGAFPDDNPHGDTYGPINYVAYVPFELIAPWRGTWDGLPAAHLAAMAFDVACVVLLYLAGRRLRDHRIGVLLAYLWLACPFTLLVVNSGANDSLVGALVLAAWLASGVPRGALVAAAALTKFAPLALAPLFATRRTLIGMAAVIVPALAGVALLDGGLGGFWERTIAFQAGRDSPFSLWGWYDLHVLQVVVESAAAALAVALAFVPRRRDELTLAALAGAVLIAAQLGAGHWFYLYVVWFLPLVLVASVAGAGRRTGSIDVARRDAPQRTRTALSHGSSSAAS